MTEGARPVLRGESSPYRSTVERGRPVVGGVPFEGVTACSIPKADGTACQAKAGEDGICIGHRRQVNARKA